MNSISNCLLIGFLLTICACSKPKEVVTAADLVVHHSAELKKQSRDFARHANTVRGRAEARLNRAQQEVAESQATLGEAEAVIRILDDKAALRALKELRAEDALIEADPLGYLSPTYGHVGDAVRFGKVSVKTDALDTVIKNIDAVRKNKSVKQTLVFAFKVGVKVSEVLAEKKAAVEGDDGAASGQ